MAEEKAKQYVEDLGDIFHFKCYQENNPEGSSCKSVILNSNLHTMYYQDVTTMLSI